MSRDRTPPNLTAEFTHPTEGPVKRPQVVQMASDMLPAPAARRIRMVADVAVGRLLRELPLHEVGCVCWVARSGILELGYQVLCHSLLCEAADTTVTHFPVRLED